MVITCQNNKNRGAHFATEKPVALAGFIQTTTIQNIGGFAASNARIPLAAGGDDSHNFRPYKGKNIGVPIHMMRNAPKGALVLFNYLAKHANLAAPIGSLTALDLMKWCQIIDEANHGK